MSNFLNSIKSRRSIYAIGKNLTVDQATIEETIREAVKHSPSSFNSQTSRVVTLYGESHHKFWEIVRETLRKMVPAEAFANTSAKIDSFSAGFGTALFYEDQDVVKGLQEFGLNIQVPLHSSHHGLHYLKLVLVHHYSTIIPSWMPKWLKLLIFHQTGNYVPS